ncbi:MAG: hypothetical protein O3C19_05395 [Bacteroidetes bacterium]|jgi:hypothetical protein|nr:hypothetical protein [Bacteroidota bacterium]
MTNEKAELINTLMEIEERIDELWEYHPENPNCIDVESEFNDLQRTAILIQSQIEELGGIEEDEWM